MSTFLKAHERLLLILSSLFVLGYLGHLYINRSAETASETAKAAQVVAQQQATANKDLADQAKQSTAQYAQLVTTLSSQNQQIMQSIASRNQTVVVQQAKDASLTAPQVAAKLAQQTGAKSADITTTGDTVTLNSDASHAAVQKMDEVDALHRDITDYETLLDNNRTQITSLTKVTTDQADEITGLKTELADNAKACTTEIAAVKKADRKSKWHYFGTGVGVGVGVTLVAVLKVSHII